VTQPLLARATRAAALAILFGIVATGAQSDAGSAPRTLFPRSVAVRYPSVVAAADGAAVLTWERGSPAGGAARATAAASTHAVEATTRTPGGRLASTQVLARLHGADAVPVLAGDDRANAIAMWRGDGRLEYAIRVRGRAFGAARELAPSGALWTATSTRRGHFAVAWSSAGPGRGSGVYVATGTVRGGLRAPVVLRGLRDPVSLRVVSNVRGDVLVLGESDTGPARIWLRRAGHGFGPALTVPGSRRASGGVTAALRPDDSVVVLLSGSVDELGVSVTYRKPGHRFTRPRLISRAGQFADVAVDRKGIVTAAWALYTRNRLPDGIAVATARPRHPFARARRAAGKGASNPSVAVGHGGGRVLTWDQNARGGHVSHVRGARVSPAGAVEGKRTLESAPSLERGVSVANRRSALLVYTYDTQQGERGLSLRAWRPG
jgi:hypothetical protein